MAVSLPTPKIRCAIRVDSVAAAVCSRVFPSRMTPSNWSVRASSFNASLAPRLPCWAAVFSRMRLTAIMPISANEKNAMPTSSAINARMRVESGN